MIAYKFDSILKRYGKVPIPHHSVSLPCSRFSPNKIFSQSRNAFALRVFHPHFVNICCLWHLQCLLTVVSNICTAMHEREVPWETLCSRRIASDARKGLSKTNNTNLYTGRVMTWDNSSIQEL
jgi:hypothetical protein